MAAVSDWKNASGLVHHTLAICQAARDAGLVVTPARQIDIFRALKTVELRNIDDYRIAIRINLVSGREDEFVFERIFHAYWNGDTDSEDGDYILARGELLRGALEDARSHEAHRDMLSDPESFAGQEVTRQTNLALRWDDNAPPLDQAIRKLSRFLATRPSRRTRLSSRGSQISLRGSLRRNISNGLDLIELTRLQKKVRKTRLIMLCDVSGSMDAFNSFLLQLMFGLQKALKNSKTFVFSTQVSEITATLTHRSITKTLNEITRTVRHWSGGTNIGAALATLNQRVLREGTSHSTVLIVISDGYDNGSIETIKQQLDLAKRRIRTLVWINPMYGASTFSVRAAGMRAAMPYVDHFLPAYDARALHELINGLLRLR